VRKLYVLLFGILFLSFSRVSAQAWEWASEAHDITGSRSVADDAGNVYLMGTFTGAGTIPGMSLSTWDHSGIFLAKYNSSGQLQWTRIIGADSAMTTAIDIYNGNIYIGGWFNGTLKDALPRQSSGGQDIFIATISPAGAITSLITDGGPGDEALQSIDVQPYGILASGTYQGAGHLGGQDLTPTSQGSYENGFFTKYDFNGTNAWVKDIHSVGEPSWGGGGVSYIRGDAAGYVYIVNDHQGHSDFGGVDTSFYYCQEVVKYNPNGSFNRFLLQGAGYACGVTGIELDEQGNIYIARHTGCNHCTVGSELSKYSPGGNEIWSTKLGGGGDYGPEGMCQPAALSLKNNVVYVAGSYSGHITLPDSSYYSGHGVFVAKYDSSGTLRMIRNSNGGIDYSYARNYAVSADNNGNIYVSGGITSGCTFGDSPMINEAAIEAQFISKINNNGIEGLPSITLDPSYYDECSGKPMLIQATTKNVSYIKWHIPGFKQWTGQEMDLYNTLAGGYFDSAGVYSAYVIIGNTRERDSIAFNDFIHISYYKVPVITYENNMLKCDAQEDSIQNCAWWFNGMLLGENNRIIQPRGPGNYRVTIRYNNGCTGVSNVFVYNDPLAVNDRKVPGKLSAAPNPGDGNFSVLLPAELKSMKAVLSISDVSGRTVMKRAVSCCSAEEKINMQDAVPGLYLLQVESEGKIYREKVIIR
jgi:hypothetical protein